MNVAFVKWIKYVVNLGEDIKLPAQPVVGGPQEDWGVTELSPKLDEEVGELAVRHIHGTFTDELRQLWRERQTAVQTPKAITEAIPDVKYLSGCERHRGYTWCEVLGWMWETPKLYLMWGTWVDVRGTEAIPDVRYLGGCKRREESAVRKLGPTWGDEVSELTVRP